MVTIFDINIFLFPSPGFHVTIIFCSIQSAEKHYFYLENVKFKLLIFSCMIFKLSKYGHVHVHVNHSPTCISIKALCYICFLILALTSCKWDFQQTMLIQMQIPHQSSNQLFSCFIPLIIVVTEAGITHNDEEGREKQLGSRKKGRRRNRKFCGEGR